VLEVIIIYFVLIRLSRYKPLELGLNKSKIKNGIILTIALFMLLQVYGALYSYFSSGKLSVNEMMKESTQVSGYYLAMVFGVALFEEVIFRGFLIPQVFVRLKSGKDESRRMFLALIISQVLFSVIHIPIRLSNGVNFSALIVSLAAIFVLGIVFALLYMFTDNLFIAIGVHAVWDASQNNLATFHSSQYAFVVVGLFAFILMYFTALKNKKKKIDATLTE
jgi:membrane protease YdiL (CAAX protease family)